MKGRVKNFFHIVLRCLVVKFGVLERVTYYLKFLYNTLNELNKRELSAECGFSFTRWQVLLGKISR